MTATAPAGRSVADEDVAALGVLIGAALIGAGLIRAGRGTTTPGSAGRVGGDGDQRRSDGHHVAGLAVQRGDAPGERHGTSTTALAVSTSTTGWSTATTSPTCTSQRDDLGLGEPFAEVGQDELAGISRAISPVLPLQRPTASRMRSTLGRWCCSSIGGG